MPIRYAISVWGNSRPSEKMWVFYLQTTGWRVRKWRPSRPYQGQLRHSDQMKLPKRSKKKLTGYAPANPWRQQTSYCKVSCDEVAAISIRNHLKHLRTPLRNATRSLADVHCLLSSLSIIHANAKQRLASSAAAAAASDTLARPITRMKSNQCVCSSVLVTFSKRTL